MDDELDNEEETLIRVLRRRVSDAHVKIVAIEEQRVAMANRDAELRREIGEIKDSIKQATDVLKVLVPTRTTSEMKEVIRNEVLATLIQIERTEDPKVAVSRLLGLPNMIELANTPELLGKGLEAKVREALANLLAEGLVAREQVDTTSGRQAWLYSANPDRP